ncbi:MAG: hypothetical protein HOL45_02315 [Chloroflexi bacterium]|jgi:hypothetical protein|nr:hypothetical protein [Chloroflexota bacterium]
MVVGETIWSGCGSEISESTLANLVNRTDAYGFWKGSQWVKHDGPLTVALLEQHYGGHITIGVYATSVANTCRFMVFDVDSHRKDGSAEKEASEVRAILLKYRIPHLEEDSDGLGGRHFWVRFNEVLPAGVVLSVIRQIRAQTGVTCEIFPKGERTRDAPYGGGFIRLPGKHHKHDHWSQFWVGGKWVGGEDAVAAWRSLPCINTRDLTRISEVSTQKRTEEHRGIQKNTEEHTPDFCTHLSSSVYSYDGKSFTRFHETLVEMNGLNSNAIQCTYEDKEGRLWLGGYRGLFRYDGQSITRVGKHGPWR